MSEIDRSQKPADKPDGCADALFADLVIPISPVSPEKLVDAPPVKERFIDPLIKPIDDALCRGDRAEAIKQTDSILADTIKKHGKNSTEYIYSLYKIASTWQPDRLLPINEPHRPYSSGPESKPDSEQASAYWKELISTCESLYGKEAKFMPMVGDAYYSLARHMFNSDRVKEEAKYYGKTVEIYENLLQRQGPHTLGLKRLNLLSTSYLGQTVTLRQLGQLEKVKQIEEKQSALASLIVEEYRFQYELEKKK